jgi:hypothetical protein
MPFKITVFCWQQMALHFRKRHDGNWWCCLWVQSPLRRKAICVSVYQPLLAFVRRAPSRCMSGCTLILRCSWCHQCLTKTRRFRGVVNLTTSLYLSQWCQHGHIDDRFKIGERHVVNQSQSARQSQAVKQSICFCLGPFGNHEQVLHGLKFRLLSYCHCEISLTGEFLPIVVSHTLYPYHVSTYLQFIHVYTSVLRGLR